MAPTVYLVSGANRGIGLGFIQHLIARENVVVFAGARDPASATALNTLAKEHHGKLHVIKLVSADEANNRAAVEEIKRIAGRLDVVIANAGVIRNPSKVLESSQENMLYHFTVNVLGPMALIQATYPLLKASTSTPKFVPISSASGSIAIGTGFPIPQGEYGTSKAAVNWMTKKLWTENPELIAFPVHPGFVETDLTAGLISDAKILEEFKKVNVVPIAPADSTRLILKHIDAATRETGFINEVGQVLSW